MSSTTTTTTTTPTENATVAGIISTIETILPMIVAGKLAGLNTTIQTDLKSLDDKADAELADLKAALDKGEAENPYVKQVVGAVLSIAAASGLVLPSEDVVFSHLRAAVDQILTMTATTSAPTVA